MKALMTKTRVALGRQWSILIVFLLFGFFLYLLSICDTSVIPALSDFQSNSYPSLASQLEASEYGYQLYIKKRKNLIKSDPSKITPWPTSGINMYFYDYFLPAFNCPYTIQRIGTLGDGGKWVCGFELFENPRENIETRKNTLADRACVVYSFGVAGESSFEAEFLERTNCQIYAYDASVNQMGAPLGKTNNSRTHFSKTFIGNDAQASEKKKTLKTIMKENNHTWIDFLKIDVEGAEFAVFEQISKDFEIFPFSQLHLEIHGDDAGKKFPTVLKLWEQMEGKGLRPFKNEVNPYSCVRNKHNPGLMEYSFLNIKGEHNRLIH